MAAFFVIGSESHSSGMYASAELTTKFNDELTVFLARPRTATIEGGLIEINGSYYMTPQAERLVQFIRNSISLDDLKRANFKTIFTQFKEQDSPDTDDYNWYIQKFAKSLPVSPFECNCKDESSDAVGLSKADVFLTFTNGGAGFATVKEQNIESAISFCKNILSSQGSQGFTEKMREYAKANEDKYVSNREEERKTKLMGGRRHRKRSSTPKKKSTRGSSSHSQKRRSYRKY